MNNNKKKKSTKALEQERKKQERKMREAGLRLAKANFIRYGTGFLTVISIYWAATAYLSNPIYVIYPLIYLLAYLVASADQHFTIFKHKKGVFDWTYYIMSVLVIVNLVLIVSIFVNPNLVFPYFANDIKIPIIALAVGIIIKLIIIHKIKKYIKNMGEKYV